MTKRESILQEIKSALTGVVGIDAANVFRSSAVAYASDNMPALSVEWTQDVPAATVVGSYDWALNVRVMLFVMDDIPDQAVDATIQDVHSKIMADTSLDGLSMDISPGPVTFVLADGEKSIGIFTMNFSVTYRTSETDLSA